MKYLDNNKPLVCMMTQSTCYKGTKKMDVKGVLWHSTGANNPTLKRYVQPDDNAADREQMISMIGKNSYGNDWNHTSVQAGLNAWIGKLADGSVAAVQTMPWDFKPWGCGSGSKGSCNNGWIQFEICEDGLNDADYFAKVYKEACELTAYLCKMFGIDPNGSVTMNGVKVPTILCHADSHKLGLGSNHGDVLHWFPKFGKSMDTVRAEVAALMGTEVVDAPVADKTEDSEKTIWDYLMKKIGNAYGVAGLMGNAYAESGLRANNLQNSYEKKLNITDEEYTRLVDDNAYPDFVKDKAGYGLAQWTYWSRKQALLDFAKSQGKSIGDLQMQLDFLWKELKESYPAVLTVLQGADNVRQASDAVLLWYERPADQSEAVQVKRAGYGQGYYDKYAGKPATNGDESAKVQLYRVRKSWADSKTQKGAFKILDNAKKCADQNPGYKVFDADGNVVYEPKAAEPAEKVPFLVKVSISDLNIRKGPGTDYGRVQFCPPGVYTIVAVSDGAGASKWGKLKSGIGWLSLDFVKRV